MLFDFRLYDFPGVSRMLLLTPTLVFFPPLLAMLVWIFSAKAYRVFSQTVLRWPTSRLLFLYVWCLSICVFESGMASQCENSRRTMCCVCLFSDGKHNV